LYYQDATNTPYLTPISYDFYLVTNRSTHAIFSTNNVTSNQLTNIWFAGYSFVTNAIFYDWREGWNGGSGVNGGKGKAVQAVQIDVAKFDIWLTNTAVNGGSPYNKLCEQPSHKSHPIDSIFVYNAVPLTGTTLPAVRVVNGGMLPSQTAPNGFTLVTPMPLYVWGNYNVSNSFGSSLGQNNTIHTGPSALMADAITILSTNWSDAITTKLPTAATTTVNAALLGGIVPSTNGIYSGGYENFPRLLESWNGSIPFWYNGSIAAMFPSRYATNYSQPAGNYYNVPGRKWAFDTNFLNPNSLPPLTPILCNSIKPPVITNQPASQIVVNGGTATFSVTAGGSGLLSYQWSFNGMNLFGAISASLALANVSTNNEGNYQVDITNPWGSVTSSVVTLTVVFPPSIIVQPASQSVVAGSNVIFSLMTIGTGPFNYQWQCNGTNITNGIITTVAGNGTNGYSGDGGLATNASLCDSGGVAVDASGNLFIAGTGNNRIRQVSTDGIIMTVAGNATNGYSGDGGAATNASLSNPSGVAVDASGNLFIADTGNNVIREVNAEGVITTAVGNGKRGYSGDRGAATNASLNYPSSVAVDASGNLLITDTDRIRKVDTNGIITTVAGNGAFGYSGDGGAATNASLDSPWGVAVDTAGNLFIADGRNFVIREVNTDGIITTVAGNGAWGYSGDGGAATNASLLTASSVAVDASGDLFITDDGVRIREVTAPAGLPTLTLMNVSTAEAGNYTVTITDPYGSVTSSNVVLSVYPTAAATLGGCFLSTDNGFQFQVVGVPGFNYAVQESTNLIDWVSLFTNSSPFTFVDTNATNFPQQFYRTLYTP
jgi:hypothetical protein